MNEKQIYRLREIFHDENLNINLFGGEPFLPEHYNIISLITKLFSHSTFSAFTNGYYLKEYVEVFSRVSVDFIQVTLDGDKVCHDKTRCLHNREGTFDTIMRGIESALIAEIPIKIRMNVTHNNISSCLQLRKRLESEYDEKLTFELYPVFEENNQDELLEQEHIVICLDNEGRSQRKLDSMHPLFQPYTFLNPNRKLYWLLGSIPK